MPCERRQSLEVTFETPLQLATEAFPADLGGQRIPHLHIRRSQDQLHVSMQ